ncbi:Replication-associated recombination protein A [Candidatus Vallotia cooleyia]|nr:Replication-associated recombination protein A [Candidatus Vallotia cooleyia]
MILWGPPGVGKTPLARLMADIFNAEFIKIPAVLSGVKDIRKAIDIAQSHRARSRQTLLFVDGSSLLQQEPTRCLPAACRVWFVHICRCPENPSFEINSALLSRVAIYALNSLSDCEQSELLGRVFAKLGGKLTITDSARDVLIHSADGDGRKLLNNIEIVIQTAHYVKTMSIDNTLLNLALTKNMGCLNKASDAFYDQVSALHKSVRGSSTDGALYWLCRILEGRSDLRYLARRIIRIAWEDIGLADPRAARIALDASETYERLGSPEDKLALAQAVLYLAVAPKSNADYNAYNTAQSFVSRDKCREVPVHLRNVLTNLIKSRSYNHAYRYAHNEPDAYAASGKYLPDGIQEPGWYTPVPRGLEQRISEKLEHLRSLDQAWRNTHKHGE